MREVAVTWLAQFLPARVADAIAPTWFMCVGLAGLAALGLLLVMARRRGIDAAVIANVVVAGYLAAVLAGIVVPMMIQLVETLVRHGRLELRWAGMTSFWGYLAGASAIAVVCRRHALPLARFADMAAVPMGAALVFARLGCFFAGCDYGKVTAGPWAMRFPAKSAAWNDHVRAGLLSSDRAWSLPVHPTQLYEAALGLVIMVVALVVARRAWAREGTGRVMLAAAATYALGRIGIEALRGDLGRGIHAGLSSGQIFSIAVLAAIAIGVLAQRRAVLLAATTAGALVMIVLVGDVHPAHAQPADPYAPAPYTPPPPYQPPVAVYTPPPYQPPVVAPPPPATNHLQFGVLLGGAAPLNRRSDQVPALVGGTLSVGWVRRHFGIWLDFDSFASEDATHGTLLISGGYRHVANERLAFTGRFGLGTTLVNFEDDVFEDVSGATFRFEGGIEYAFSPRWVAWVRPLALDVLTASGLGGPITTFQARLGISVQIGVGQ